jgi:acyl-coenzyme A thioesterase 13
MIMEFLRIVTVAAFAYATAVLPTNSPVILVVAALAVAAISHALFPTDVRLTQAQKLQRARLALAATAGSSTYNLADHLHAGLNAEGAIELRLALTPALHNFLGSMHGGAIASAVDVATTIAIIADGGYPGVSTSLGCTYLNGCAPDEVVRLVPTVLRRGANLTYTECKLYRADGVLMARGWHGAVSARAPRGLGRHGAPRRTHRALAECVLASAEQHRGCVCGCFACGRADGEGRAF